LIATKKETDSVQFVTKNLLSMTTKNTPG